MHKRGAPLAQLIIHPLAEGEVQDDQSSAVGRASVNVRKTVAEARYGDSNVSCATGQKNLTHEQTEARASFNKWVSMRVGSSLTAQSMAIRLSVFLALCDSERRDEAKQIHEPYGGYR
jgi:hypothetical protein